MYSIINTLLVIKKPHKLDKSVAKYLLFTLVSRQTGALVMCNLINAGGIVPALVALTLVYVNGAVVSRKPFRARALVGRLGAVANAAIVAVLLVAQTAADLAADVVVKVKVF